MAVILDLRVEVEQAPCYKITSLNQKPLRDGSLYRAFLIIDGVRTEIARTDDSVEDLLETVQQKIAGGLMNSGVVLQPEDMEGWRK